MVFKARRFLMYNMVFLCVHVLEEIYASFLKSGGFNVVACSWILLAKFLCDTSIFFFHSAMPLGRSHKLRFYIVSVFIYREQMRLTDGDTAVWS